MSTNDSTVTIHMVASLDGFISKADGSISWMESKDTYDKGVTLSDDYIQAFIQSIDCYIMGSQTYEQALELGWPYGDVPVIVLTRRDLQSDRESVEFFQGDLEQLIHHQVKPKYNNIWMVGGAQITKQFIQLGLADQIVISIMPILLGDGILFFDFIGKEQALHLLDSVAYQDGMVELTYEIIK